ncbi:MAG: DUF1501 domain-containing protein [Planctomycetaceae bacterium]|nr:DUF1501 domain-containing protein [Planctomycetaceae bacterium]
MSHPQSLSMSNPVHPRAVSRRTAVQAGAVGLLGLGMNHLQALQSADAAEGEGQPRQSAKSCIYIFLSGGLAQHESFDMKPQAPDTIRGEFSPIATSTPGLSICEHLPMLAARSHLWALCRSLTHSSNEHSAGHHIMLTGRSLLPPQFNAVKPLSTDWPSIAAIAGVATVPRNNLPPVAVLPERLVHSSGRVIPGQFAGEMGSRRDPWFIEASPFHSTSYGAYPEYAFDHQHRNKPDNRVFQAPNISLSHGVTRDVFRHRVDLLDQLEHQRQMLDRHAHVEQFDLYRQGAISLLNDPTVRDAIDVTEADDRTQERYGKNSFGWSLLMARRLIETGVNLVQVNLGSDETWDTHGNAFPHLKDKLLPPTDRAVSALLDDLHESGQLDDTLIVMAGEFGRTPKISHLKEHYALPGRDHWGAVQSVFFAGGGVRGGNVIGASDAQGGYPEDDPQTPENFAATIYQALGIPANAVWHDAVNRPHQIYYGNPILGLI